MEPPKVIGYILIAAVLCTLGYTAKQAVVSRKSKLCGNAECGGKNWIFSKISNFFAEILFKARVKRVMGVNSDPSFLNLVENAVISVVAVKFSDRPDIMEGKLNDEGPSGFFYAGAIDIMPFAEFLRAAIDEKKEMLMISQNPADIGDKRIVGYVHSETDLVRDYNAKNAQAAAENGLPPPEALPIPEPPASGHGHSHGGHGHSHGGHGHSHGHPAPTPEPAKAPEMTPEVEKSAENAPKLTETAPESAENAPKLTENAPDVASDAVKSPSPPPPNLNNVLGGKPEAKIGLSEMDLEIERMIREEEERMTAGKQEEKQEDLVLKSLPESLKFEQIQPEVVENAPEVAPKVVTTPESVTTTTLTPEDVPPPPITQATPTTAPVVLEEPAVPTTTPPPLVLPEEPVLTEGLPEEPVAQTVPVEPPVVAQDELTGVCYKENCDGLQTPPPPQIVVAAETAPEVTTTTPTPESPESAHLHHGHSHDGAEGHGHSHDAPEDVRVPEVVPEDVKAPEDVKRSPEEEEFLKWENERSKREAAPYEDAQSHQFQHGLPPNPPTSAGIFDWIRSALSLGNVTDGTVLLYINLTFFIASLVFYVIVRSLSTGGDSDVLDRQ
ncbi:hypothetical protein CRE_10611 [Caenorhabditis remanei]|uniref:Uncharacterized protein n=1 Tax=Caenorhabditis remanei TaxID=31234 RepID=E3NBI7_CAERE|nr:hypothetical protein CRE_10611 [Caenorhabditis remanei]